MKQNKVCLYGLPCSGKSFALASLFKIPNMKVLLMATERNSLGGLELGLAHYGITLQPGQLSVAIIKKKGKFLVNELGALKAFVEKSHQEAQVDKTSGNKSKYKYFSEIILSLMEFEAVDHVTKETTKYGNIGEMPENLVFVVDGLTPIMRGIWENTKGDRVISQLQDYSTVQYWLNKILEALSDCPPGVILLAHAERHTDDFENKEKIRVAINAGTALNSSFLGNFQNGIYAYRHVDGKFYWAGSKIGVDTAPRDIPAKDNLTPDFSLYPIFNEGEVKKK